MKKKSPSNPTVDFIVNLLEPLLDVAHHRGIEGIDFEVTQTSEGFDIQCTRMYDSPIKPDLDTLMRLADIFGTRKIDVDNYSAQGCETCDYGSAYGYTFNIIKPTKNIPPF